MSLLQVPPCKGVDSCAASGTFIGQPVNQIVSLSSDSLEVEPTQLFDVSIVAMQGLVEPPVVCDLGD